ncbi:MAG: hypothetical protein SOI64_04390 [Bifidobacterium mongoliense]|jgi:hypothetical protein|uniref:hypothetical protein n=1 Tax=Bifidobacterium mongoliense TaxID=518643 RepID=UPI002F3545DB
MQRINLFPNPNFEPNGTTVTPESVAATMQDNSLHVTAQSTSLDSYAIMNISNLTPGDTMIFAVTETSMLADGYTIVAILNSSWSALSELIRSSGQRMVSMPFTVAADGVLRILFYPYRHDAAPDPSGTHVFTHPQLELASTYNSNERGGGAFFSGSTMPLD